MAAGLWEAWWVWVLRCPDMPIWIGDDTSPNCWKKGFKLFKKSFFWYHFPGVIAMVRFWAKISPKRAWKPFEIGFWCEINACNSFVKLLDSKAVGKKVKDNNRVNPNTSVISDRSRHMYHFQKRWNVPEPTINTHVFYTKRVDLVTQNMWAFTHNLKQKSGHITSKHPMGSLRNIP